MARNLSVEQFKQLLAKIPPVVAAELAKGVDEQAHLLLAVQRAAAARGKTGNLQASGRVEVGRHELQRLVKFGGRLTTKPVRKGFDGDYDYAVGTEHGNERVPAQPFFYPSYRLMKKRLRAGISRKVKPAMQKIVKVE